MKATKPPRETLSSLNYRDAEATPTDTNPALKVFAGAALTILARDAAPTEGGEMPGDRTWRIETVAPSGARMDIRCTGPSLPDGIPDETAHPSIIPYRRPWEMVWRLTVKAPLVVFDIAWRPGEPLRIMNFSRGNWEGELREMAGDG